MVITLYYDFQKRKNSTKRPTGGTDVECQLKRPTSVESPTFILNLPDSSINLNYIKWGNNYYFVEDIILVRDQLMEVSCSMDALATNKEEIGNYVAYVERAYSEFNNKISDAVVSSTQEVVDNRVVRTDLDIFNDQYISSYLVRMVGGDGTANGSAITNFISSNLNTFTPIFNPDSYYPDDSTSEGLTAELLNAIKSMTRAFFDPFKYIVGVYRMPISLGAIQDIDPYGDPEPIFVKWFDTGVEAHKMQIKTHAYSVNLNMPTRYYNDWRDAHPSFVTYNLYLPSVGSVPLPSEYMTSPLKLTYNLDMETGDIFYKLMNITTGTQAPSIIGTYTGNVYARVQIGQQSANMSSVMGAIGQTATSTALGNISGAITGLANGVQALTSPAPSINGAQASAISVFAQPYVTISSMIHGTGIVPSQAEGRPLCDNRKINTLSGYIKCSGASLNLNSYGAEKDIVNGYLNGGFYYE